MVTDGNGALNKAAVVGALLRTARGPERSQEWVAERSGLGLRTVGNLERGDAHGRAYNIAAYAHAVGLSSKELRTVGREDAAKELDDLKLGEAQRLTHRDRRLIADMRTKRRSFATHDEWLAWLRTWAPDLLTGEEPLSKVD